VYEYNEVDENVKENDSSGWCATNVVLTMCGNYARLTEAHENNFWYGGERRKQKVVDNKVIDLDLGRASEAEEEQQENNKKRVQKRRNRSVRDLMNCNEDELIIFETLTGHGDYTDLTRAHNDRKNYQRRLERFCQTGKLYGKPVKGYIPTPEFKYKNLGVVEFQDGKRNNDGKGTGNIHFHHFQNVPVDEDGNKIYYPQVCVIHAKTRDPKTLELKEMYLNQRKGIGFYWSKAAGADTPWFNSEREARQFLLEHKKALPGLYFNAEPKRLCVNALLWQQGHTKIKKLKDLRKQGKCANAGEYLCKYMNEKSVDPRLRNRRGWYKTGKLAKPEVFRDPAEVEEALQVLLAWEALVNQIEMVVDYMGAITMYFFNFWVFVYPWIKTYYERRAQGLQMTQADWIATGVIEQEQPLLL
jgi:hypothetical protein